MSNATKQFAAFNQANTEAAVGCANIMLDSTGRLADVQLKVAKTALADGARNARLLSQTKDTQDLLALQSEWASSIQGTLQYSRDVYAIAAQARNQLKQILEERTKEFNQAAIAALEQAAKAAPANSGTDVAVAAVKSAMATANSAYDNLSKTAGQIVDLVEANLATATADSTGTQRKAGKTA